MYMNINTLDKISQLLLDSKLKLDIMNSGLPVKKYFTNYILSESPIDLDSEIMFNSLYSIRAYTNQVVAMKQELKMYNINRHETVIVHPFTPQSIVNDLIKIDCNILSSTIDYDNLTFEVDNLIELIENQKPTLVIIYSLNQMYNEYISLVGKYSDVKFLVIDDSKNYNIEFYKLLNTVKSNLKVLKYHDNSIINNIDDMLFSSESQNVKQFFAIDLDSNLLSHMNNKTNLDINELSIDAMMYLLNKDNQSSFISKVRSKVLFNINSIKSKDVAISTLNEHLNSITEIDDIWFYIYLILLKSDIDINDNQVPNMKQINSNKRRTINLINTNNLNCTIPKEYLIRESGAIIVKSTLEHSPVNINITNNSNNLPQEDTLYYQLNKLGLKFYKLPQIHECLIPFVNRDISTLIDSTLISII